MPNCAKLMVSFVMIAPKISKPGPDKTAPIPFTIPLAISEPRPSPCKTSLTLVAKLLKKDKIFLRLSVTPISPRVLASSFKLTVASLIAAAIV